MLGGKKGTLVEVIIKLNMNRVFDIDMNATIIITVNCSGKERSPD